MFKSRDSDNESDEFYAKADTSYQEMNRPAYASDVRSVNTGNSEDTIFSLPYMAAMLFATVLEDTIQSLCILGECNNQLRVMKTMANMKYLLMKKHDILSSQEMEDDMLQNCDQINLGSNENKLKKMAADKNEIGECFRQMYMDMSCNFSFRWLLTFLDNHELNSAYGKELELDIAKNKAQIRDLHKQLRSQRNIHRVSVIDYDTTISRLTSQVEDASQTGDFRELYAVKWQSARKEMLEQRLHDIEDESKRNIQHYKNKNYDEHRIHDDMEAYYNMVIQDRLQAIEDIMDKYDEDMESMDVKMQIMKNEWANMRDRRKALQAKLKKRENQMKDWIQFKEDRMKTQVHRETMEKSALVIQAWWRGILQRLKLGPFRPKKGFRARKARKASKLNL